MTYEEALTYLTAHGQQHLLRYYPTLTPAQQEHLLEQISNLHLERPQFQNREAAAQQRGHFAPLGAVTLEQIAEKADEYHRQFVMPKWEPFCWLVDRAPVWDSITPRACTTWARHGICTSLNA